MGASVTLAVDYRFGECSATGKTLNLSEGGMFLCTAGPAPVGTRVSLRFALPEAEPWEGTAEVVWIRRPEEQHPYPAGMALQFVDLPPDARPAIGAFVARLLAGPKA